MKGVTKNISSKSRFPKNEPYTFNQEPVLCAQLSYQNPFGKIFGGANNKTQPQKLKKYK